MLSTDSMGVRVTHTEVGLSDDMRVALAIACGVSLAVFSLFIDLTDSPLVLQFLSVPASIFGLVLVWRTFWACRHADWDHYRATRFQTALARKHLRDGAIKVNKGDQSLLIPVTKPTLSAKEQLDLEYFVEKCVFRGHSRKVWLKTRMPSGQILTQSEQYNNLIEPLIVTGIITGRGAKISGNLITHDADEIKHRLREAGYLSPLPEKPPQKSEDVSSPGQL